VKREGGGKESIAKGVPNKSEGKGEKTKNTGEKEKGKGTSWSYEEVAEKDSKHLNYCRKWLRKVFFLLLAQKSS